MKFKIVLVIVIILLLFSCKKKNVELQIASTPNIASFSVEMRENEAILKEAIFAYENFLNGKLQARYSQELEHEHYFITDTVWQLDRGIYALFDMNGDKIPELHVRGYADVYDIYTCQNGEVVYWNGGTKYTIPTDDRALMDIREEYAPKRISYQYRILNFYGSELLRLDFEKNVKVEKCEDEFSEADDYDEKGLYIFDNVEVSKSQWEDLTKRYLSSISDSIIWYQGTEDDIILSQDMLG